MSERKHDMTIEIDAPPEVVWKAISEADGITRWFAPIASIDGDQITISWGPGCAGTAPIRILEPGKRFGWVEGEGGERPKVCEFQIQAREGGTTLRLVQSGFGEGADFDNEYDSTMGGWKTFLAMLKYSSERYAGAPHRHVHVMKFVDAPQMDVWTKVGDLTAGVGTVVSEPKPGYRLLEIDGGMLALFSEKSNGTMFTAQCVLFGDAVNDADAWLARLKNWEAAL